MTKFEPRIVFFDIDETLHRKLTQFMPESAYHAIKSLRERGIHTAIATGRTPASFPEHIRRLFAEEVMDVLVAINGQYNCQFQNQQRLTLSEHPLDLSVINPLVEYFRAHNWDYAGISPDAMAVSSRSERVQEALRGIAGCIVDPDYALTQPIHQMLLFVNEAEKQILRQEGLLPEQYEMIRWHPLCTDLLNQNGAKSRGVRDVCAALDIPLAESMAFGDGLNDVEMMQTVGFGVAMGDAREEVKTHAKYITGTVEQHGIANALKELGIIS